MLDFLFILSTKVFLLINLKVNTMIKKTLIVAMLGSTVGCASLSPSVSDYDYGSYKGYKELITTAILDSAKNPDSIVIKHISEPKKTFVQNLKPNALWEPLYPAYGICVNYKGTNSYGAYMETTENFYIRNGKLDYEPLGERGYHVATLDKFKPCNMR